MKIATGNDLRSGDVVWWDGSGWSRQVGDAIDVGADGTALIAREEAAGRVNVPYLLDATAGDDGPRPAHIKDRIRAYGPTVRDDFAPAGASPAAGNWVI